MTISKSIIKIILFLSLVISLFIFNAYLNTMHFGQNWVMALSMGLSTLFMVEVWTTYFWNEKRWANLSKKEKLIYFIGSAVFLAGIVLPMKENIQWIFGIPIAIIGILTGWLLTRLLGSRYLRHFFLGMSFFEIKTGWL